MSAEKYSGRGAPFDEPLPPYAAGSDTSEAAAESMRKAAPKLRHRVLMHVLRAGPAGRTCDEVEADLGLTHQTASARIHELWRALAVCDSGFRRKTRSGRKATVWVVP